MACISMSLVQDFRNIAGLIESNAGSAVSGSVLNALAIISHEPLCQFNVASVLKGVGNIAHCGSPKCDLLEFDCGHFALILASS